MPNVVVITRWLRFLLIPPFFSLYTLLWCLLLPLGNNILLFRCIVVFRVIINNTPIETHKAFTNINTQGFITHENSY